MKTSPRQDSSSDQGDMGQDQHGGTQRVRFEQNTEQSPQYGSEEGFDYEEQYNKSIASLCTLPPKNVNSLNRRIRHRRTESSESQQGLMVFDSKFDRVACQNHTLVRGQQYFHLQEQSSKEMFLHPPLHVKKISAVQKQENFSNIKKGHSTT